MSQGNLRSSTASDLFLLIEVDRKHMKAAN